MKIFDLSLNSEEIFFRQIFNVTSKFERRNDERITQQRRSLSFVDFFLIFVEIFVDQFGPIDAETKENDRASHVRARQVRDTTYVGGRAPHQDLRTLTILE